MLTLTLTLTLTLNPNPNQEPDDYAYDLASSPFCWYFELSHRTADLLVQLADRPASLPEPAAPAPAAAVPASAADPVAAWTAADRKSVV